ncbi:prothoracicostatic peptides [Sitophilus oryzae]|uniref:Prothoracicostatic peptides n=1 Tax=Sitophilus oryzae TaxID=7048 RepID=A0A6J2YV89_SITOR|nr:prothoracicostatic peptides [Sitophilus oryzae]
MFSQLNTTSFRKGKEPMLYAVALVFCLELVALAAAADDIQLGKTSDENPEAEYSKRGWKTDLPMWGKRGWSNLHSGWGKRDFEFEVDPNYIVTPYEKKSWQRLQGGWGKRFIPSKEDMVIRQLAAALEEQESENENDGYYPDQALESHELNKRNWNKFTDGWGKRSEKWEKFKGSWGKREPAWNNLKGLWGKRSLAE